MRKATLAVALTLLIDFSSPGRVMMTLPSLGLKISIAQDRQSPRSVVIKGATLIDVHTGGQLNDSEIVIEGDLITQVGRASAITTPKDAQVIDGRNKWIIPGLMDMHAHVSGLDASSLVLFIANGVTTIRDPGGNLSRLRLVRQEIDSGERVAPRLFLAGYVLDGNPPLWPALSIVVETPERAESVVNSQIDQGVDLIKVYNSITEPVLAAIVLAAHKRGVPVIGHVPRSMTMTRVAEMGIDGLEHIRITGRELLTLEEANRIDFLPLAQREALLWQRYDLGSDKMKRLISFLAEKKVSLDPTLTIDQINSLSLFEQQSNDPNNRFLPRHTRAAWSGPKPDVFKVPSELKEVSQAGFKKRMQFVEMCSRAGVQIIAGTDGAGLGKLLPGFGLQHELQLLSQAGLSPVQVVQAATINAARALRKEKDLGSIESGKLADLVILNSNPLVDIRNMSAIHAVITRGRVLDRKTLDEILTQAETESRKN
ncbi:MAG: amidohydrolase family protein [Blastocatellia bacterium]